jgi:hypothetical protein
LSESASMLNRTEFSMMDGIVLQLAARCRRAGEGHDVLTSEVIEQITSAADDKLQRALGKNPRLDHRPHHRLR